ncbi:glycosyltransferase family 2 protein [Gimesia sp.]|uniref:glycosyltransferase family 2 protein n=1 Tax=Gimesia sp. TaxID=2024833 RepID=UPI003A9024C1
MTLTVEAKQKLCQSCKYIRNHFCTKHGDEWRRITKRRATCEGWGNALQPPKDSEASHRVAIVVTCHNYGRYLAECLESVLVQTSAAAEIIVIDDASTDDTPQIAAQFASRGVQYLRVNNRSAILSRWDGVLNTESEIVLFQDADDVLPPDFIECGLKEFTDLHVGVVYCDHQHFGISDRLTNFPDYSKDRLFKGPNFVSTCSLVRREALLVCDAWHYGGSDRDMPEDYWMFQRIALDGWDFRKQTAVLKYRRHKDSRSQTRVAARKNLNYYQSHGLEYHTVTLFIPLAGRKWMWERLSGYLDRQTWPHDQIRLVFCDTSQDAEYSSMVRQWIVSCDYSDVRHFKMDAGTPGLADRNRRERVNYYEVKNAVCKIYNQLRLMLDTPYCWILEDDIIPPDDVLQRLLWHFHHNVGAAAAPYQSRFNNSPIVWLDDGEFKKRRGKRADAPKVGEPQLQEVRGYGFGCTVIREELVKKHMLPIRDKWQDLDPYFFSQIGDEWRRLCDWSCACEHWGQDQVYLIGDD